MATTVQVQIVGPLLAPGAEQVIQAGLVEAQRQVAQQAYANVMGLLDRSIRNPTPYYETQVTVDNVAADLVVHDRDVIYGPWLEGTGSRNQSTRFKGYASFRRAFQQLNRQGPALVERALKPYLSRLS